MKKINSDISGENNLIEEFGFALMAEVKAMLLSGCIVQGMSYLFEGLKEIRDKRTADEWKTFSQTGFLKHPLTDIIYQDPFTRHSFDKPRGYSGDAELLDYIYGLHDPFKDSTALGLEIFKYTVNTAMPKSVRARRDILAQTIDAVAAETNHPARILAIACGHLREANKSEAILTRQIGELIALDQDPLSLEIINKELSNYPIKTLEGSVKALIQNKLTFEHLDLVYAAGIYDYLSQPFATRLTKILFDMLRSGGRLLIANFMVVPKEISYMETFMKWDLLYRNENTMEEVAREIAPLEIFNKRLFFDKHQNIIFLEIQKA